jgi:hypothetical protein
LVHLNTHHIFQDRFVKLVRPRLLLANRQATVGKKKQRRRAKGDKRAPSGAAAAGGGARTTGVGGVPSSGGAAAATVAATTTTTSTATTSPAAAPVGVFSQLPRRQQRMLVFKRLQLYKVKKEERPARLKAALAQGLDLQGADDVQGLASAGRRRHRQQASNKHRQQRASAATAAAPAASATADSFDGVLHAHKVLRCRPPRRQRQRQTEGTVRFWMIKRCVNCTTAWPQDPYVVLGAI